MIDRPLKILVILGSDGVAARIAGMLAAAPVARRFEMLHCPSFANWLETANDEVIDGIIYIEAIQGTGAIEQIVAIRQRMLDTPLIAITRAEGSVPLELVSAGADDFLTTRELTPLKLARTMLIGRERKRREVETLDLVRSNGLLDTSGEWAAAKEIEDLVSLAGEEALPISNKAYSVTDFSQQNPQKFNELVETYAKLIDEALEELSHRTDNSYRDSVAEFADSIGMLNLGPRDIINIHKEVILRKAQAANQAKLRAYISEGRLLLVQLMGHVLTFYRSFFWGCRALAAKAARERSHDHDTATDRTRTTA